MPAVIDGANVASPRNFVLTQGHQERKLISKRSNLLWLIFLYSAPGTAAKGTNGCFSNCGLSIKQTPRTQMPMRVGYFEAWNLDRPCLNMDISKMTEGNYYTHVHYGFGDITPDWQVDVSKHRDQYDGLKRLRGIKRVMAFGGWAFSTEPATYEIFRNGVKDGNRQLLAANVVRFIIDEGLDGVDFDWEYPGVSHPQRYR